MLNVAVGHSTHTDPVQVVQEIRQQVAASLNPDLPCACVLFCGHPQPFSQAVIDQLHDHYPTLQLVGCSSYAEASSQLGRYAEHSCTAMFFCTDTIHIDTAVVPNITGMLQHDVRGRVKAALDPLQAARPADKSPKLCLVFTELMQVNHNALVQILQAELGNEVIVLGGASGHATSIDLDNPTAQYRHQEIHYHSAVLMVFSGPLAVSTGVCLDGWHPLYERRMATAMQPLGDGRHLEVMQIDGQPALDFYERSIGVDHLPEALREPIAICYPLLVYGDDPDSPGEYFDVFGKRRDRKSLIITDDVSPPYRVDIATPVWQSILDDVASGVRRVNDQFKGAWSVGALFFSCCSRSVAYQIQNDPSDELQAVARQCKPGLPIIGAYTYLEIGNRSNRPGCSRRESMTLVYVLLGEDWSAIQAEINSHDPVQLQKLITAVRAERNYQPPISTSQEPINSTRKTRHEAVLVEPATSGCAKAETLLIEAGMVLRYLSNLPVNHGQAFIMSWLSDDQRLVAKYIAQDLLRMGHPRLPKLNTLERHLSQAIKLVKNGQKQSSLQRFYYATLTLGMLLLCLEDSGGLVPLDWVSSEFSPQIIAGTLYQKLQSSGTLCYSKSLTFLANSLQDALQGANQFDYVINETYRI